MKLLPYGISDFRQLRAEGKYYVDKTMFLPVMERTANFLFLIRPRRFGKSVFISMMRHYYDINERDNFASLFEGLWIADNPTQYRGQFQVLHLDFSRIGGDMDNLEANFSAYCNMMLDDFVDRYADFYGGQFAEEAKKIDNFRIKFSYIDVKARQHNFPLYLIVDEYDNFTNTVLNEKGERVYWALTHAYGFYRDVFKLFKGMFARILMMGVSPVTLDDLTSGYNIATNISFNEDFNLMLGFSETDVRQMIRYYQGFGVLKRDEEELIAEMKPWYDNYCFARAVVDSDPKMFNPDMVLYYLNYVMRCGRSPEQMIDPNMRTDYNKMMKLIQIDSLSNSRRGVIHQIADDGYIYATPVESFPAKELADEKNFVSLLLYYGMLTIGGTFGTLTKLIIPNNNVRKQYYEFLLNEYQSIARVDISGLEMDFTLAAIKGEWRAMLQTIADSYSKATSVRQLAEGERSLQGFMNAYLSLSSYWLLAPEMELSHGYCDFFLMPDLRRYPMVAHSYILELKYLPVSATPAQAEQQWLQAEEQIRRYAAAARVKALSSGTTLHLLILQIRGYNLERFDEVSPEAAL